jgi:hypothetical protein
MINSLVATCFSSVGCYCCAIVAEVFNEMGIVGNYNSFCIVKDEMSKQACSLETGLLVHDLCANYFTSCVDRGS